MIISIVLAIATAWCLTYFLRLYAIKKNVIDVPNIRSSHAFPTPRGGGLSIVIVFLLSILSFIWIGSLPLLFGGLLFLAGILVALVGWLDDHGHVRASWRFLVHLVASSLVLYSWGGVPQLFLFDVLIDWGLLADVLALFGLVWILNLYNFMDGIDGIAGIEAVCFSFVIGLVLMIIFNLSDAAHLFFLMFGAVSGFLIWNFPPAKIFMGDAGSGFLGLMLGALSLYATSLAPQMFWVCGIMLGVFIVDATFTLIRRLIRGDKVYEAHRSHAYQYAARYYGRHLPVTLAVLAINLIWLAPISYLVATETLEGLVGMIFAYTPLVWLAWYFKAGEKEITV